MKAKIILNHEFVQIIDNGKQYSVLIHMVRSGQILEHEPYERSLRGLVSALTLATEVISGKFYPRAVFDSATTFLLEDFHQDAEEECDC